MKKIKLVDLVSPYFEIKELLFKEWEKIFQKMYLFLGDNVQKFEKDFAEYCGVKHCVGVSSGTDALHLALRAVGIGEGDEVILPSFTFIATFEVVWMIGAKPVFADIEEDTLCISPSDVEKKITSKTRAIIPVHIFGNVCNMDSIYELKKIHGFYIVEDSAQAHGAEYKGKKVGNLGDVSAFSFYYTKNLSALGEAGGITTNDDEIYENLKLLRNHGQVSSYMSIKPGFNARLDEVQAAVLNLKLKKLDEWNERRRKIAELYRHLLSGLPCQFQKTKENVKHVYHYFVIRVPERDKLVEFLRKNGVEVGIHYPFPCHLQKAVENYGFKEGDLPVTEKVSREVLSLPSHPYLNREDVEYICSLIRKFYS